MQLLPEQIVMMSAVAAHAAVVNLPYKQASGAL